MTSLVHDNPKSIEKYSTTSTQDLKQIDIRTRSVEKALEPLITQVNLSFIEISWGQQILSFWFVSMIWWETHSLSFLFIKMTLPSCRDGQSVVVKVQHTTVRDIERFKCALCLPLLDHFSYVLWYRWARTLNRKIVENGVAKNRQVKSFRNLARLKIIQKQRYLSCYIFNFILLRSVIEERKLCKTFVTRGEDRFLLRRCFQTFQYPWLHF